MDKAGLRIYYKKERQLMSADDFVSRSERVLAQLKKRSWNDVAYLHLYIPIQRMREIDTWPFMDWLRQHYPALKIVVSRSNPDDSSMSHYLFRERRALFENKWGILEPQEGESVDEKLIDAVIIPLLVADKAGNRVGYGKGFYDRFLAKCRPDCLKIGLSLFPPVEQIDDVNEYDVPLDVLITP
ncbi:5-formyltetrahydrofolate cyclo-ligase [Sphingobacterium psychroaquaticum]|uniref:5-formyltetrahydrofolate cyclo-ligase n=1 Tax=Sphingobacterium psychroaquaticum TaxID=561061 RepID=A0A1X7K2T9_9SPHI|nr:5-formyltetrahydrofolate cyclo-ligase [Sphingobacterium psychroaquaticum]SMG35130.1 5-formyltetrahydrofolate cyclo-ligase [Sphingobacterium psychroaquaticum]